MEKRSTDPDRDIPVEKDSIGMSQNNIARLMNSQENLDPGSDEYIAIEAMLSLRNNNGNN